MATLNDLNVREMQVLRGTAMVYPLGRNPYFLVILTQGIENHESAQKLIANLSGLIYYSIMGEPITG